MSDYIMCNNQECMNADYCRRQTDERKKRQQFKYFLNQGDKCDHFIPNDKFKVYAILAGKSEPELLVSFKVLKSRYRAPAFYVVDLETYKI